MTEVKFTDHSTVELIDTNASDLRVAQSAWASTKLRAHEREATPERIDRLVRRLVREGHVSTLEHCHFTMFVETPIFVARQIFRTRTASYNEQSARYSTMPPIFYVPNSSRPLEQIGGAMGYEFKAGDATVSSDFRDLLMEHSLQSYKLYEDSLNAGVAREMSRCFLPVNLLTQFHMTINARNLMHFIDLRTDAHAQHEVREVATQMEEVFREHMPITWSEWREG